MLEPTVSQGGWVHALESAWGAVPASELLEPTAELWTEINLPSPDIAECVSFGTAGRALKYGQSMAIALPVMGSEGLTRLMVYLHRIRLDSLQGGIRSPWLNPENMERCPDIVFISRPRAGLNDISRVAALRARVLKATDLKRNHKSASQTLVVDGSMGVMELVDTISKGSRPFVLVVDGTRGGNDNFDIVDSALEESFPLVPRITLLSLGDSESLDKMRLNGSRSHLWVMRLGDKAILNQSVASAPPFHLAVIQDGRANTELAQFADRFFALRRELHKKDFVLKERLAIIGKVFRALNELSMPLHHLERALIAATRPGLYPIRCLERWLEVALNGSSLYGESDVASRNLITELGQLRQLLMQSIAGKAGWLLQQLRDNREKRLTTLVLCGSSHEVTALDTWLDSELEEGWSETIQIGAMDGVRAYRRFSGSVDEVIITGLIWPNRQHWLATPCRRLVIPAYDYEQPYIQRMLQLWWLKHGAESLPDGDKLTQWQLEWTDRRCDDGATQPQSLTVEPVYYPDCSQYPTRTRHASVPLNLEYDDWLDLLVEQPDEPSTSASAGEVLAPELIWITTEGADADLPWEISRPVLVLRDDEVHPTLPEDLVEGDQIILLKHSDERIATQETLFDMVAVSEGIQQILRTANRWKTMVDSVSARLTVNQVQVHLRQQGVTVGNATVANWFRHKVYGPRDRQAVTVFAKLHGAKQPEKTSLYVANAIEQLRVAHQIVGKQLRKAILERGKGATTVEIGLLTLDARAFDDMIEIAKVVSIRIPAAKIVSSKEEGLLDIASRITGAHPGRIRLTTPAVKSMRDSVYRDLNKFDTCLSLMATKLYEHYSDKTGRLHEVLEHFKLESIDFEPKMSPVAMGMFADDRRYKGKPANMNRHFCLGNARDPARTLRIHFDWDAEERLLVIHHAGKHLETTQS
ncbi:hypothetical protein V2K16_14450 [Pseudomonas alliivorans]|uniref:DISARM anti-phage system protein DrmE domain-containing protein n=1 Tax=Pseudomonas alliivorans TaxID=2810613 RepID=UPI001AE7D467|nr:hypothetical protein [Pseudomonas alliivorans]MBP0941004.1 hypothetical protein [Pseudomonas alliivorans]MEE4879974.1 hypothetical protein [Pseudomonas alliivorans]MEE4930878.1 hypothetical protein [Pseudomonas alliivorans]MEE4936152.1 hypothetical protein [Pseudomonas alliivorans]MEE4940696.1 hypothetical protein [Pseudomonas alliivorans]